MKILIAALFTMGLVTSAHAQDRDATLKGTMHYESHKVWSNVVADLRLSTANAEYTAMGKVSEKDGLIVVKNDGNRFSVIKDRAKMKASEKYIYSHDPRNSIFEVSADGKREKQTDFYEVDFVYGSANVTGNVACIDDTKWVLGDTKSFIAVGPTLAAVCAFDLKLKFANSSELSDESAAALLQLLAKRAVKQIYTLDF